MPVHCPKQDEEFRGGACDFLVVLIAFQLIHAVRDMERSGT